MSRLVPILVLAFCSAIPACSQATPTAYRTTDLVVFAEYQRLHTDYAGAISNGIIAGLDYARYLRGFPIIPSLELRANYASEQGPAGEQVALGGLRTDLRIRSYPLVHPYANFLIGAGQIDYYSATLTPIGTYSRDNSIVYNIGGGVSFGIGHGLEVQAEYQHQSWNLSPKAIEPYKLSPSSINAGVRYHVHFPSFHGR